MAAQLESDVISHNTYPLIINNEMLICARHRWWERPCILTFTVRRGYFIAVWWEQIEQMEKYLIF